MSKMKTLYVCQECGGTHVKWQGRCDECGAWNSLVEEAIEVHRPSLTNQRQTELNQAELSKILISRLEIDAAKSSKQRFSSTVGELDRVLGGGVVPGAVMLIGGEPGIGKSTLLTQMCLSYLSRQKMRKNKKVDATSAGGAGNAGSVGGMVLYVCGEESPEQISLRINRFLENEQLFYTTDKSNSSHLRSEIIRQIDQNLQFAISTDVDQLSALIRKIKPSLVVVDSIQTLKTRDLTGASGSVGQIRESAERLIQVCKALSVPIFLVGHVTKEGVIAGPKVLEHMVDAVLQLEGERVGQYRLLRALKNRFGATDEVGLFKVTEYGYEEVSNPSELFVENNTLKIPGSALACVMEGTRPLIIEVQALVTDSQLAMPRRVGRGVDLSRIQVLAAVLQKHCSLPLGSRDIFLSAAGGFKINEPAVDLALAVAIASSMQNKVVSNDTVFVGEIGLLGEVRQVMAIDRRIKEITRLGYKTVISSNSSRDLRQVLKKLGLMT